MFGELKVLYHSLCMTCNKAYGTNQCGLLAGGIKLGLRRIPAGISAFAPKELAAASAMIGFRRNFVAFATTDDPF